MFLRCPITSTSDREIAVESEIPVMFLATTLLSESRIAMFAGASPLLAPISLAIIFLACNRSAPKNMTGISDSTAISLSDVEVIGHRKNIKLSGHNLLVDVEHDSILTILC